MRNMFFKLQIFHRDNSIIAFYKIVLLEIIDNVYFN